jgi:hypothetical protein
LTPVPFSFPALSLLFFPYGVLVLFRSGTRWGTPSHTFSHDHPFFSKAIHNLPPAPPSRQAAAAKPEVTSTIERCVAASSKKPKLCKKCCDNVQLLSTVLLEQFFHLRVAAAAVLHGVVRRKMISFLCPVSPRWSRTASRRMTRTGISCVGSKRSSRRRRMAARRWESVKMLHPPLTNSSSSSAVGSHGARLSSSNPPPTAEAVYDAGTEAVYDAGTYPGLRGNRNCL